MRGPREEAHVSGEGPRLTSADGGERSAGSGIAVRGRRSNITQRTSFKIKNKHSGFTIIELLITMAVIVTGSAIAVPNFMAALYLAKVARDPLQEPGKDIVDEGQRQDDTVS